MHSHQQVETGSGATPVAEEIAAAALVVEAIAITSATRRTRPMAIAQRCLRHA
jgi:hypothetical protein